jgi:hypothetical protein
MIHGNSNFGHNLHYPKYICPTNIPLLKNSSLSSYFDIMYEIYTLDVKNPQDYYKSIFQENIVRIRGIREENKLKAFHEYDLQSRRNIIYQKPVLGNDVTRLIKLNLIPANLTIKQYSYGNSSIHELFYNNTNNSIIFNKFFKKTNFDKFDRKEKLNNKIYEGIYKDRELQNELDRLISLLEQKEKELEEEKEKEIKAMNINNIISHHTHIRKIGGINHNNADYKNNLIQNQNKKINSSININNLNLNLTKNKHLKMNNLTGNLNKEENPEADNSRDTNTIEKNGNYDKKANEENEKIKEDVSGKKADSTLNDVDMNKENEEAGLVNQENAIQDGEINEDEVIDIENDQNDKNNKENQIEVEEFKDKNTSQDIEINIESMFNGKHKNDLDEKSNGKDHTNDFAEKSASGPNNPNNKVNEEEENNKNDLNSTSNQDPRKNPNINSNYSKLTNGNNSFGKNNYQFAIAQNTFKQDPDKLKEIEDLKSKITLLKKLLKPKQINKIKENFIEMKLNEKSTYDSIRCVHTEALNEMIFNPQKMMNICEELMTRYKFFIPKIMSSGPKLLPSKISSENQQLNTRYRMLYNNLNRVPNVQKYLSLFKIISLPDKKLVEYDSGKLMKLAKLLKNLKQNKSKALIFTQVKNLKIF